MNANTASRGKFNEDELDRIIQTALTEDAPTGDVTSALLPETTTAEAFLVARETGVWSGSEVFARVFTAVDPTTEVNVHLADGSNFAAGDTIAIVRGTARSVLQAERVALNLAQRMCGIATLTRKYVDAIKGTGARLLDTRKTTPGLRILERASVKDGGGHNHRNSLSDAVMLKDNHLAVLRSSGTPLDVAVRQARVAAPAGITFFEVEVDKLEDIEPVMSAGVDRIMLDNFTLADLRVGVEIVNHRAIVEASGGVTLDTIRAIAETGVDDISVGALTHSARALDLGLDINLETGPAA